MAFNKFMHPRNRYKDNKPNFDELAEKYPDFGRHVIRNQAGKATLDFHDAESLRSLTCTLLKEDFGLKVELPLDRLIPTLSLRLNYIHWIEDLLASTGHNKDTVWGIDIGCGASCIYPLLGAQMNGWNFLASEVDALAIHYAKENITRNGLGDKITVVETVEDSMFEQMLDSAPSRQPIYHFTMCNPPFFGNSLEAQGIMTSRSMSRPEPKSVSTAAELEMIADGGEVEFVHRMIEESLRLRNQVVWYTSMLGKKSSLSLVREELRKHKIRNVTHTEFCQGRTMRWGIAWTFKEDMESPLPACKRRKLTEKTTPFTIPVPDTFIQRVLEPGLSGGLQNKIQAVAKAVHHMMQGLEMSVDRKPSSKWCAKFDLTAAKNTWSHQRRKRRQEKWLQMKSSFKSSTVQTPKPGEPSSSSSFSSSLLVIGEERPGKDVSGSEDNIPSLALSSSEVDELMQGATSDLPVMVSSHPSSLTASSTDSSVEGRVMKRTWPNTSATSYPSKSVGTSCSQKRPYPTLTHISSAPKASCESILESTHQSQEDTHETASHDCAVGKFEETAETSASSQSQMDIGGIVSKQPTEAKGMITEGTKWKDHSSSDEADESFPLDIHLDVKLGDRRTIVLVASMVNSTKRNLLHQVVQYIKNQMK